MTKSDKIREYFRKHPDATPIGVANKFDAPRPMVYKLRKEVSVAAVEVTAAPAVKEISVDDTLNERAQEYGRFKDGAELMQGIKRLLADHAARHNKTFADDQWEALEMIVHKMARIVNGNPDKVDSWLDVAGYATLVADRLKGNPR
jgi:hypothetical protein